MVCTLGGALTLGAGGIHGFDVGTLGSQCLFVDIVRRGRSVVDTGAFVYLPSDQWYPGGP